MRQPFCLLLAGAFAVLVPDSARSDTVTLTVAGDVTRPLTYDVELQGSETIVDLLVMAGIQAESRGNACLFRGDPPKFVTSQPIRAMMAGPSQKLAAGDIVIFHDETRPTTTGENVVIAPGGVPRVVQLTKVETTVGELLRQLEVEFAANDRIPLWRTERGLMIRSEVLPDDTLAHGDVVLLSIAKDVDPVVISRLFSGPDSDSSPTEIAGNADNNASMRDAVSGSERQPPSSAADVSSGIANSAINAQVVSETNDVGVQAFIDNVEIPDVHSTFGPTTSVPPAPDDSTLSDLAARPDDEYDQRAAAVPLVCIPPSTPQTVPDVSIPDVTLPNAAPGPRKKTATASKADVPSVAFESDSDPASAATSPLWNGIFIFGLFGAGVLIATGWLKTRAEQKSAAVRAQELMNFTLSDSVSGAESEPMIPEQPDADAELDRLIRNRIPMQLCQADLPLKVTLFGRPAGPQRLRIDAAHEKVAAPHFAAGSRRETRRPTQARAAAATPETAESGSLDRALNSLTGHNES